MNTMEKLFACKFGFAVVVAAGIDEGINVAGYDPVDEAWVQAQAPGEVVQRVAPSVVDAWGQNDWTRPIEVAGGYIFFVGEAVATAILAGRNESLEENLGGRF